MNGYSLPSLRCGPKAKGPRASRAKGKSGMPQGRNTCITNNEIKAHAYNGIDTNNDKDMKQVFHQPLSVSYSKIKVICQNLSRWMRNNSHQVEFRADFYHPLVYPYRLSAGISWSIAPLEKYHLFLHEIPPDLSSELEISWMEMAGRRGDLNPARTLENKLETEFEKLRTALSCPGAGAGV